LIFKVSKGRLPGSMRQGRSNRADRFDVVYWRAAFYLRAAQAYMLISMPTGTSTILGVFQVIPSSEVIWRELHAGAEPRSTPDVAQVLAIED
jgi:hypothetical protein